MNSNIYKIKKFTEFEIKLINNYLKKVNYFLENTEEFLELDRVEINKKFLGIFPYTNVEYYAKEFAKQRPLHFNKYLTLNWNKEEIPYLDSSKQEIIKLFRIINPDEKYIISINNLEVINEILESELVKYI